MGHPLPLPQRRSSGWSVQFLTACLALGLAPAARAAEPAWENISQTFFASIGADAVDPKRAYATRCQGLIVAPTGDIVVQTASQGICLSKDQGATWAVVSTDAVFGRCEDGFGMSIGHPYTGRMAFFCFDGRGGHAGGMSLDGGRTWQPFAQQRRGVQFGNVDWSDPEARRVFAVTHEPYLTIRSGDGGRTWQQLDPAEDVRRPNHWVGLLAGDTLVRARTAEAVIECSEDAGRTWTLASGSFRVVGNRPVQYGAKLYWTTTAGVITSTTGKAWTLTGPGAEGAWHGPYFGASENDFVIVTGTAFLRTQDGGATWKTLAPLYVPPDVYRRSKGFCYFGWDGARNILYASGLAGSVYRMQVQP